MQEEMIEVEEAGLWNEWLRALKRKRVRGLRGGECKDFWWEVRKAILGLIGLGEDEAKEVSPTTVLGGTFERKIFAHDRGQFMSFR